MGDGGGGYDDDGGDDDAVGGGVIYVVSYPRSIKVNLYSKQESENSEKRFSCFVFTLSILLECILMEVYCNTVQYIQCRDKHHVHIYH